MEYLAAFLGFLEKNAVVLGGGAALLAIVGIVFAPFRMIARRRKKPEKVELANPEILLKTRAPTHSPLTEKLLEEAIEARIIERVAEASHAHGDERERLQSEIDELKSQLRDPEKALNEAQARIADLEGALQRIGNEAGGEELAAARAALQGGDTSLADKLFAGIEAREALAVGSAAHAAFARGEIAEAEVRWADAAAHYARAAGLAPSLPNYLNAAEFARRSGYYPAALHYGEQALELARAGDDQVALATSLNNLAALLQATGRFDEAEPLYWQALEIRGKAE